MFSWKREVEQKNRDLANRIKEELVQCFQKKGIYLKDLEVEMNKGDMRVFVGAIHKQP